MTKETVPERIITLSIPADVARTIRAFSKDWGVTQASATRRILGFGLDLLKNSQDPEGGVYIQKPGEPPQRIQFIV